MRAAVTPKIEVELMQELLSAILTFMANSGLSPEHIDTAYRSAVLQAFDDRGRLRKNRKASVSYGCDTIAGAVLRAWHREPAYLSPRARPIAVKLNGRRPSLSALVRSQDKAAKVHDIVSAMLQAGLIESRKGGWYLPKRQAATISEIHPLSVDHVAKTVIRLVETASRNMLRGKNGAALIERYAHVPDLRGEEADAFASFTRQQGQAYLDAVEDWLEARRQGALAPVGAGSSVNAGVHIFAFLGEVGPRPRRDARGTRSRATSPRATVS